MTTPDPLSAAVEAFNAPMLELPEWNALTNEQRSHLCRAAEDYACRECYHFAADGALALYNRIRETVKLTLPPLVAPFHWRVPAPTVEVG